MSYMSGESRTQKEKPMLLPYNIRTESPRDYEAAENLTREAFWNVYRPGCTEHYVLHTFRTDPDFVPELSFVMEHDGAIMGHVMYARALILADSGARIPVMTFGPISIHPDFQRKGYGKILLDYSMDKARQMKAGCLLICGSSDFYGKSGFTAARSKGIRYAHDPDGSAPYFLCRELEENFLRGITGSYTDPEGYFAAERHPAEFEAYEARFPHKKNWCCRGSWGNKKRAPRAFSLCVPELS